MIFVLSKELGVDINIIGEKEKNKLNQSIQWIGVFMVTISINDDSTILN